MNFNKYYNLDPFDNFYYLYFSDLTQEQQTKINNIYDDLEEEEYEENGYKFRYFIAAPFYKINAYKDIYYFLKNEGFIRVYP